MANSVFESERLTERSLIESILSSFYIIDYGYIKTVNPDETIDVIHAKKLKLLNGKELNQTLTKKIEVLTVAGSGFSFKFDYKKGDKVLLLGLKNYIKKVEDVTSATETTAYTHYTRETLKAIPMCVFNKDAKVKLEIKDGNTTLKGSGTLKIETEKKIELNGNSKQFVTWAELNQALQQLITKLNTHTHTCIEEEAPTSPPIVPMSIDISASKTTTVVTGG